MMRVTDRAAGTVGRLTRSASGGRAERNGSQDRFEDRLDNAEREEERPNREEPDVTENALPPGWGLAQAPAPSKLDGGGQTQPIEGVAPLKGGFSWTAAHEAIAPLAISTQGPPGAKPSTTFQTPEPTTAEANPTVALNESSTAKEPAAPTPVVRTEPVTPARAAMAIQEVIPRLELLEEGQLLRIAIDRDLSLEVAWAEDGIEVRMDGTPEAVAPLHDIGAQLADLLSQSGTDLLEYSTHERDEESSEHLKSGEASPDEEIEAEARPLELGNLVNVIV